MDLTPLIPAGRQLVEAYGDGHFRVSGTRYDGSIIIFRDKVVPWPVASAADISPASLAPAIAEKFQVKVLLIGCGAKMAMLPKGLREALRGEGIVIEPMDTGAACRTYNVLLSEDRLVAAALIAVG